MNYYIGKKTRKGNLRRDCLFSHNINKQKGLPISNINNISKRENSKEKAYRIYISGRLLIILFYRGLISLYSLELPDKPSVLSSSI